MRYVSDSFDSVFHIYSEETHSEVYTKCGEARSRFRGWNVTHYEPLPEGTKICKKCMSKKL